MALSSFVYISDVDNLSDARYAAGMGVNLIGFKLDPEDKASLNLEEFQEISEWISGVKIVGEFGAINPKDVKDLLGRFKVDYLLVSNESQIHDFSTLGLPLIYKAIVNQENKEELLSTLNYCSGVVDFFLLESDRTTLDENEMGLVKNIASSYPIILGYGINAENIAAIINELQVEAICLKGSPELRPGYKNFDEMADILEALDID